MLLWTHVCFHFTYDYISFVQVTKKIRYNLRFFYGPCCSTRAIAHSKPNEAHTRTISFLHTWHSQRSQAFKNNLISINCYIMFIVCHFIMMMPVVRLKWHFIASNNILHASANISDNLTLFYLKHGNAFHGRNTLYLWQLVSHKTSCMLCTLWSTHSLTDHVKSP